MFSTKSSFSDSLASITSGMFSLDPYDMKHNRSPPSSPDQQQSPQASPQPGARYREARIARRSLPIMEQQQEGRQDARRRVFNHRMLDEMFEMCSSAPDVNYCDGTSKLKCDTVSENGLLMYLKQKQKATTDLHDYMTELRALLYRGREIYKRVGEKNELYKRAHLVYNKLQQLQREVEDKKESVREARREAKRANLRRSYVIQQMAGGEVDDDDEKENRINRRYDD